MVEKVHICTLCGDSFADADLAELKEMGEKFSVSQKGFICPDCLDDLSRKDPEEQIQILINQPHNTGGAS